MLSTEDIASQLLQGKKIDWNQVVFLSEQMSFLTAGLLDVKILDMVDKGLKSVVSKVRAESEKLEVKLKMD